MYQRSTILYTFYANTPERLPRVNAFKSHEVKFADTIRNCEDVLLIEEQQLAIVACDDGREKWNVVQVRKTPRSHHDCSCRTVCLECKGVPVANA